MKKHSILYLCLLIAGAAAVSLPFSCLREDIKPTGLIEKNSTVQQRGGILVVAPLSLDFGNVVVGTSARLTVIFANVGDNTVDFNQAYLPQGTQNFTLCFYASLPIQLLPREWCVTNEDTAKVDVIFTPASTGLMQTAITVTYDEFENPAGAHTMIIPLQGNGIVEGIDGIIDVFNTGITDGTIQAANNGELQAMRNALDQALAAYEEGDLAVACKRLEWFLLRTSSEYKNSKITGPGVEAIRTMVINMMAHIGCS